MLYKNVMAGIFGWQVTFTVFSFTIIKFKYWLIFSKNVNYLLSYSK